MQKTNEPSGGAESDSGRTLFRQGGNRQQMLLQALTATVLTQVR